MAEQTSPSLDGRRLAPATHDAVADVEVDVIGRSGHATIGGLLEACRRATGSDAEPVWVPEDVLEEAGVAPWTQLPCWVPETGEYAGFLEADTGLAHRLGLRCRPVGATVADTWAWLRSQGGPPAGGDGPGLPADLEDEVLRAHGRGAGSSPR